MAYVKNGFIFVDFEGIETAINIASILRLSDIHKTTKIYCSGIVTSENTFFIEVNEKYKDIKNALGRSEL